MKRSLQLAALLALAVAACMVPTDEHAELPFRNAVVYDKGVEALKARKRMVRA